MPDVTRTIIHRLPALLLAALCSVAWGHPGHGEAISREEAVHRATAELNRLIASGKVEKSWKLGASLQTAELRGNGSDKEWAVIFANAQASDVDKRTLYVFLSDVGEYLAANFTGR